LDIGYTRARQALLANINFLVEETYAWQLIQTPTFVPSEGVASFKRRLGYFIEAIAYDLTYGGNSGSLPTGYEYWVADVSTLSSTERTQYAQAIGHLQNISAVLAANNTVTPTYQISFTQVFDSSWSVGAIANPSISEKLGKYCKYYSK
jgi:hypothetical protein